MSIFFLSSAKTRMFSTTLAIESEKNHVFFKNSFPVVLIKSASSQFVTHTGLKKAGKDEMFKKHMREHAWR